MYFFFVKEISANKWLVALHHFPASEQASVENYSRFLLDIQTGSLHTTGSTRKQTNTLDRLYNRYYWVLTMHQFTLIVGFLVENPRYHPETDKMQMLVEKHQQSEILTSEAICQWGKKTLKWKYILWISNNCIYLNKKIAITIKYQN